jgi:hypothetical protein
MKTGLGWTTARSDRNTLPESRILGESKPDDAVFCGSSINVCRCDESAVRHLAALAQNCGGADGPITRQPMGASGGRCAVTWFGLQDEAVCLWKSPIPYTVSLDAKLAVSPEHNPEGERRSCTKGSYWQRLSSLEPICLAGQIGKYGSLNILTRARGGAPVYV